MLLLLDVEMEAPVISMPRCSDSRDALEVDLGHLQLRNALSWRGGAGAGDKKVKGLLGFGARAMGQPPAAAQCAQMAWRRRRKRQAGTRDQGVAGVVGLVLSFTHLQCACGGAGAVDK